MNGIVAVLQWTLNNKQVFHFSPSQKTREPITPHETQRGPRLGKKKRENKKQLSFLIFRIEKRGLNLMRSMQQGISTHYNTRFRIQVVYK